MSEFVEPEMKVAKPGEAITFCSEDACPLDIPAAKADDSVNHPRHYTKGGIECIEAIKASMFPGGFQDYCKGNVLKYIWRWREKGGIEDLEKADIYLRWLIESAAKEELKSMNEYHIVDFDKYCGSCKHKDENPNVEGSTCDICLSIATRENSRRPEKYEEAPSGGSQKR